MNIFIDIAGDYNLKICRLMVLYPQKRLKASFEAIDEIW